MGVRPLAALAGRLEHDEVMRGMPRIASLLAAIALLGSSSVAVGARDGADTAAAADTSHGDMSGMAGMDMSGGEVMAGMYGTYPMSREASGTAWAPDATPHAAWHVVRGEWTLMLHGSADLAYDRQGGPRGGEKVFASNMLMGMGLRALGPGTLGLRAMVSAEPATIGTSGYPLLLQTGETADGVTPLVDRQHPHDAIMELASSYSVERGDRSLFVYAGLPGEPALGPPAFMHRFSAAADPLAPITHHWLDSTHVTFGVVTLGAVADRLKVEASAFRGREPDEHRWNLETPKLDSWSWRVSLNPTDAWALQVSHGHLVSPEQLEPQVDQDRTTASVMTERAFARGHWQATLAWGRNANRPGRGLDAFAFESAAEIDGRHTLFARAERVRKDELFVAPDPRAGQPFTVGELTAGYRFDFWHADHVATGIGGLGTLALVPDALHDAYGRRPLSAAVFLHVGLR